MNTIQQKKCQIQAILVIGIFSIGIFSSYAQAEGIISVTTSKKAYNEGDIVVITGQVSSTDSDIPVTLQTFHGGSLADIVQLKVSKSGKFSHTILAQGPLWQEDGIYTVRATYGPELMKEIKIEFLTKSPLTESVQYYVPEPQQKAAPGFIDPSKGSQYYFDRYYNEPAYKTWFDTNYPDYTIEEAIELSFSGLPSIQDTTADGVTDKPRLPEWIRNIFVWYGEERISEDDLLSALQFLLDNGILRI